jgi:hypothetical protein
MKKTEPLGRIWIIPIRFMHIKAELKLFESQIKTRWMRKKLSPCKLYFLYNKHNMNRISDSRKTSHVSFIDINNHLSEQDSVPTDGSRPKPTMLRLISSTGFQLKPLSL